MRAPLLALAVMGALAGGPGFGYAQPQITAAAPTKRKRVLVNQWGSIVLIGTRRNAGTVAQAKRAAIKAKNRAKHRRACK